MTLLDDFIRIFQLPPAMIPHLDFVVQEHEMALVVALGDGPLTIPQIAEKLALAPDEAETLLQTAYTRSIVNREVVDGVMTYTHATFSERLDPLSMYENWRDVPAEARAAVVHWQFEEFVKTWQPEVEALLARPGQTDCHPQPRRAAAGRGARDGRCRIRVRRGPVRLPIHRHGVRPAAGDVHPAG